MSEKEEFGLARGLTNYGDRDFSIYLRRSFASSMGYSREMLSKKIVGIAYTPSGYNNCHRHFPEMLEAVKRGILTAGALPVEFPTISLGEVFLNPTSLSGSIHRTSTEDRFESIIKRLLTLVNHFVL